MPVTLTPFLRKVLYADILFSGAGAILMVAGSPFLPPWLDLPADLLVAAGLALIPWVVMLVLVVRRVGVPGAMLGLIVGINFLWAVTSVFLLASGWVQPNALGIALVAFQAAVVALLGALQYAGLRQASMAA